MAQSSPGYGSGSHRDTPAPSRGAPGCPPTFILQHGATGLPQGNVGFVAEGETAAMEDAAQLSALAELTATAPGSLRQALLTRTVAAGGGELIEKGHSPKEAAYARDACAKVWRGCRVIDLPPHQHPWVPTTLSLSPGHLRTSLLLDRGAHQRQHRRPRLRRPPARQEHRHRRPRYLRLRDLRHQQVTWGWGRTDMGTLWGDRTREEHGEGIGDGKDVWRGRGWGRVGGTGPRRDTRRGQGLRRMRGSDRTPEGHIAGEERMHEGHTGMEQDLRGTKDGDGI